MGLTFYLWMVMCVNTEQSSLATTLKMKTLSYQQFPDLNPIENLWDYFGGAIASKHPPHRNVDLLKTIFLEEWSLIPQLVVNNVMASRKQRCDMLYTSQRTRSSS